MPGFDLKKGWLGSVLASLRQYPAAVPGALRGHLNTEELARVTIAAIAIGGGAFSLLNALAIQAGAILPGPADSALAVVVFSIIAESRRRLGHGEDPPRDYRRRKTQSV